MKNQTRMKKILSILLALAMALQYVPVSVFAVDTDDVCRHGAYLCHICPVQEQVDALPAVTAENLADVKAQLAAIDASKAVLTAEELAQVDFSRYTASISSVNALEGQPGAEIPVPVMRIFVLTEDEEGFTLEVEPTDRIEDVKAKIYDTEDVEVENQTLIFEDEILEHGNTLQDYSIRKDATLYLVVGKAHTITISETENGTVEFDRTWAVENTEVSLTVTPDRGYELESLTVTCGGTELEVAGNTFTMPSGNVTVAATFKKAKNACVTGVAITVDGVTYTEGHVTITPTSTVVYTLTGESFANLTRDNILGYSAGSSVFVTADYGWIIDPNANAATQDYTDNIWPFTRCDNFKVKYSNDNGSTWTDTGIYLTYDGGSAEDDKAQITGVAITVDGITYTEGEVIITPETQSIVFSAKGNNLANREWEKAFLWVAPRLASDVYYWFFNPNTNSVSMDHSSQVSWFEACNRFEVQYSNDGRSTWIGTGIYLTYCESADNGPVQITGVTLKDLGDGVLAIDEAKRQYIITVPAGAEEVYVECIVSGDNLGKITQETLLDYAVQMQAGYRSPLYPQSYKPQTGNMSWLQLLVPSGLGEHPLQYTHDGGENWIQTGWTVVVRHTDHTGGEATCTSGKICEACGEEYGEADPNGHTAEPVYNSDSLTHFAFYPCCNASDTVGEAHSFDPNTHCCVCGQVAQFTLYINLDGNPDYDLTGVVTYGNGILSFLNAYFATFPGSIPAKNGYDFTGEWTFWLDSDCAEPYDGATMPGQVVYAQPVFQAIEYTITWDMNGCTYEMRYPSELPTKLPYSVDAWIPVHEVSFYSITAPEGYSFKGFVDGNGNALEIKYGQHDMSEYTIVAFEVSGDMTIRAVIEPQTYMAVWENGEGGAYEKEFTYGETITIPNNEFFADIFRKEGYTLTGWDGYTEGMTMPAGGVTYTAIYTTNRYTITFDCDGGSEVKAIIQDYGTAITAPAAPAKDGFHFVKWDVQIPETMPAENLTLKAIWEAHDHAGVVTVPTCEAKGYTTYTCVCGDSYVADYVDALGHDWQSQVTKEPGCEESGIRTFTCKHDASHTYTETIPAAGHSHMTAVTAPTCEAKGYTTYTCVCGDSYVADYVDALGHDWQSQVTKEPGCEESGIRTFTCKHDASHTYTETILAVGHSFGQWQTVQEATCTQEGQERRDCENCDHHEIRSVAVLGHVYHDPMDPTCEICGQRREVSIATVPMYRLYNPNTGEHHYTGSESERDHLRGLGWNYEGVAWSAPVEYGAPVHRYFNPNSGDHHYTMSEEEGDNLKAAGWIYEGVAWNSASSDHQPIFRLYNPNATVGTHHYTGSADERDDLVAAGWHYEGIAWYALIR